MPPTSIFHALCPLKVRKKFVVSVTLGISFHLLESRRAATHHFALAYQLGVEFRSVKREIDVKVYSVECSLWGIHSFEVLFEVLAREI
jgi:hypothetical protein